MKTFLIVLITHSLGVKFGGEFIFVAGLLEILRVLADFGVDVFVIKKYNDCTDKTKLLALVFRQKILIGFAVFVLLVLYCFVAGYDVSVYLPVAIALPLALLFNLSNSYFQSANENKKLTPAIIVAALVTGGGIIAVRFIVNSYSAWCYLFVEIVFVSMVTYRLLKTSKLNLKEVFLFSSAKPVFQLYKNTANIGLTAVIVMIYSRLDNFYIKFFAPADLAAYGQIFRMIDPLVMVSSVFSTVAYARFCHLNLRESKMLKKLIPFLLCVIGYGVISSSIYYFIIDFVGDYILIDNKNNHYLIICLLIVAAIKCFNGGLTAILQSQGLYKIGLYISNVCIITVIPVMYFLTEKYGVKGTAGTLIIIETISLSLLVISVLMIGKRKNVQ